MLQHVDAPAQRRPIPAAYEARCAKQKQPVPQDWRIRSGAELGRSGRRITADVRSGAIIRARTNVYLDPGVDADCLAACEIGGRLTCVSELARWGVFVLDGSALHIEVPATSSRLRRSARNVRVHWSRRRPDGWASVDIVDALVEAVRCQPVQAAIATLDSALHLGLIGSVELGQVFAVLPRRLQVLRRLLDASAESGAESIMRLLLRRLGCRIQAQVEIPGVGRVDFLVDGWLIVECDSEAHHSSWEQQKEDRRRDQAAAARGYATYRPIAEDIFWHQDLVLNAVRGIRGLGAPA